MTKHMSSVEIMFAMLRTIFQRQPQGAVLRYHLHGNHSTYARYLDFLCEKQIVLSAPAGLGVRLVGHPARDTRYVFKLSDEGSRIVSEKDMKALSALRFDDYCDGLNARRWQKALPITSA